MIFKIATNKFLIYTANAGKQKTHVPNTVDPRFAYQHAKQMLESRRHAVPDTVDLLFALVPVAVTLETWRDHVQNMVEQGCVLAVN